MLDIPDDLNDVFLQFSNDEETPWAFVVALQRTIFGRSQADAVAFAASVDRDGKADCGPYPPDVAKALLEAVNRKVASAGHPLSVTVVERLGASKGKTACSFCGEPTAAESAFESATAIICSDCLLSGASRSSETTRERTFKYAHEALSSHFAGTPTDQLVTTSRQFPGHMRADVQIALDHLFSTNAIRLFGIFEPHRYETLTFAALTDKGQHAHAIAPGQYQDIDVGEDQSVRCLVNGLWLCRDEGIRYAVVLSRHREYGQESGTCVEIAVPVGEAGSLLTTQCFTRLEAEVKQARSYRGKVLSLEADRNYQGRSRGIMVHRLPPVARRDVILPESTLELLDRNVLTFIGNREKLRALGQSTRKGILLYGPPGTGKTHTIRYLASNLANHTTLIITAEQIALLGQYMNLARLLQPSLVVIEDVDLIARAREGMNGPCEEVLLNKLLNEMDGLKEDADILFILTTNRPEQLETALAGRPGRVDQAIEVPLPDADGRAKLVALYGKDLALSDDLIAEGVRRTEGVSAAFIKELMRRTAQASLDHGPDRTIVAADLDLALDDMLFRGGALNLKLLGASALPV